MAKKLPLCPRCGTADTYRIEGLRVRPAVYGCEWCLDLFTATGSSSRQPDLREVRRAILRRWDQLADDAAGLAEDIRSAPRAAFTDEELNEMLFGLEQTVWDVLVNERPRLSPSPRRCRRKKGGWAVKRTASTKAPTKVSKPPKLPTAARRSPADAEQGYRDRLVRWAELMGRVQDLDYAITSAAHERTIGHESAQEALELLAEVYSVLAGAVPTRHGVD